MLGNREQSIVAGNQSTNVQGNNVTVNQNGLDYLQVRQVAMDVFKSNFYDLGQSVEETVLIRAENLLNDYLKKLQTKAPETIANTQDVDVRYAIFEAQKNHARLNNDEIQTLLVDLLIQRTITKEEEFKKLVLNEALEIIPKLTTRQIDTLTFIFIVKHLGFTKDVEFDKFIEFISPIWMLCNLSSSHINLRHMEYSGCISISAMSKKVNQCFMEKFPDLFPNVDSFNKELGNYKILDEISNQWDKTDLRFCSLTSVGIAIAITNWNTKVNENIEIGIWIKE